jgi:hypothetical protein
MWMGTPKHHMTEMSSHGLQLAGAVSDHRPWVEQPGQLLELYETTLRYPNLPNVDMAIMFGDEMSGTGMGNLLPLLIPFKGDQHRSAILVPNSGHYR